MDTLDLENGSDGHHRRHGAGEAETMNNILYAPDTLCVGELISETVKALEKDGKVPGVGFDALRESWVVLQMLLNNQYASTAAKYTGRMPYVREMISHTGRNDEHPAAHWNAGT